MKRKFLNYTLAMGLLLAVPMGIVVVTPGCSLLGGGYDPGADPVVVNAQQVRQVALDTVDTYLKFEKSNRIALWKSSHEFKKVADELRMQFPLSLKVYNVALDSYKAVRDSTNKANLETAAANLATLGTAAQTKLTAAKQTK